MRTGTYASGSKARIVTVFGLLLILCACGNPFDRIEQTRDGIGRVVVSTGGNARTVVPDFFALVTSVDIVLTSQDGFSSKTGTISPPQTILLFDSVEAGTWDVIVTARMQGTIIGAGIVSNQTISSGTTSEVVVPVTFDLGTGTGALLLKIEFPQELGIDYVEGSIGTVLMVPPLIPVGITYEATFDASSLIAGYSQDLHLTFRRGGSSGTTAGQFLESINIYSGLTSDHWVDPDGQIVPVRKFTSDDFLDATSTLSDLRLSAGAITFAPNTMSYDAGSVADQLTITPIEAVSGQYIQYRLNGGAWIEIGSGETSSAIVLSLENNSIEVSVRAPDQETVRTYALAVHKGHLLTYNGNGNSQGSSPVDQTLYTEGQSVTVAGPGTLTAEGYLFFGWNTEPDGTGTTLNPGQTFTMGASAMSLYALWEVFTPTFSPPGGTYTNAQSVTISCPTAGATIRYTTDGTDPTATAGTVGNSVSITSDTTLKAIAYQTDHPPSSVQQAHYSITATVTVGFTLLYPGSQVISFATTDVSVPRGQTLVLGTTNSVLSAISGWKWYVNLTHDIGQTTSSFSWNTTGWQPGQYIINVTVVYEGVNYSGSLRATVTY